MRKVMLLVAVLLMTVQAMAANVVVTATDDDVNCITLSYATDGTLIRAFGLDITLDDPNVAITRVVVVDANYRIYPSQIEIDGGEVTAYNTPYDPCDLGDANLSIEMGSLYTDDANYSGDANAGYGMQPQSADVLLKLYIQDDDTNTPVNYAVAENTITGGVVLEDPCETTDVNIVLADGVIPSAPLECMALTNPAYANWQYWSMPDCWCYARQCRGDADGLKLGPFWVSGNDLAILRGSISKLEALIPPGGICADFDHQKLGPFWVSGNDLAILRLYISKLEALVPVCANPPDSDYNFWMTP